MSLIKPKKIISREYLWVTLIFATFSCTVYKDFPIDIYQPASVNLPDNTINIGLISRNFQFSNDTLQNFYKADYIVKKDKTFTPAQIDSIEAVNVLQSVSEVLNKSEIFNRIEVLPYGIFKPASADKMPKLNWAVIRSLNTVANVDAFISLETYSSFYSEFKYTGEEEYPKSEVITASVWCVYDPVTEKVKERISIIDTVYWDSYDENNKLSYANIPPRLTAIKLAAEMAGKNYAARYIPAWHKVNRLYIIPPIEDFRVAALYFEDNKIDRALNVWKKYSPERYRKLAIVARYNCALAFEMKDDHEEALKWINEALLLAVSMNSKEDIKMILLFQKVLNERQEQLKHLNHK